MLRDCPRCGGCVVAERLIDEDSLPWEGFRCVNCGDRTDPVIIRHRAMPVPPAPQRYIPLTEYTKLPRWSDEELADAS